MMRPTNEDEMPADVAGSVAAASEPPCPICKGREGITCGACGHSATVPDAVPPAAGPPPEECAACGARRFAPAGVGRWRCLGCGAGSGSVSGPASGRLGGTAGGEGGAGAVRSKIVRDNIPTIVRAEGREPRYRVASAEEMVSILLAKLAEEAEEFRESRSVEELADLAEVVRALSYAIGCGPSDLERARADKAHRRGGFGMGLVMELEVTT